MTLKNTILLFLLAYASICNGQQHPFIQYDTKDGLAQSQVRAIEQDRNGYIWFGTQGGLSRFDGFEFLNFSSEDGLPSNQINCFLSTESRFWIGSAGSLTFLNGNKFEIIPLPEAFSKSRLFDLEEDLNGNIWIAMAGDGLLKFDGERFEHFGVPEGLPNNYVRTLALDKSGAIWVGTSAGTAIIKDDSISILAYSELDGVSVSDIFITPDGASILCSFGFGVFIIEQDSLHHYMEADGLQSNHIRCVGQLPSGELWFGAKEGLSAFDGETFTIYREAQGLQYSNIKSLNVDREGNLWLGTDGKGALIQAGRVFTSYNTMDGLHSDLILSVCEYKEGELLFASYGQGIFIFNPDSIVSYAYNDSLPNSTVWVVKSDTDGTIWAGTSQGLFREHQGNITVVDFNNGLPGNRVTALSKAREGYWVGAEDGFAKIDFGGNIVSTFNDSTGFHGKKIRSIQNEHGTTWIGAEDALYVMSQNGIERHVINPTEEARIYSLELDRFNQLWIGTSNGLYVTNKDSINIKEIEFSKVVGAKNINFLQSLKDSTLVIGTNNGIYRIGLEDNIEYNSTETKHYTYFEGLTSSETNQNSSYLQGEMLWFGTTSGVVRFAPETNFNHDEVQPTLNITNVQLFLEDVEWHNYSDSISTSSGLPVNPELPHNKNYITFNFSGISLSNPEKVRYKYTLVGADETWLGPTKSRSVTYAYLPHGDYTFKLESFSEQEPLNANQTSFQFTITPPFYLTPWFFVLAVIFIAAILYVIYLNQVKKEDEKRANLQLKFQSRLMELESQSLNSSMNRHFIFNSLNSIQYYINMQDRKSANRYLTSFAKLIRKNLDSSQQNETSLKDELDRLELYLSLEQMRFQGRFDYKIKIEPNVNTDDVKIPAMMLQPFLENSIWHGILPSKSHGEIEVLISSQQNSVEIKIQDNGIGVETSKNLKSTSDSGHISQGMDITQNRIQLYKNMTGLNYEINGPFEIKNGSPDFILGTVVTIQIPNKINVS